MKFRPVGIELFYVDGQTDRQIEWRANGRQTDIMKFIVACRNFANGPINWEANLETEKLGSDW